MQLEEDIFREELAIKDLKQKRASKLVTISVVLWGCFSVQAVADEPVKIMPLGDSITRGHYGSEYDWGYRQPLCANLTNSGYDFDFVGGQTDGDFADPNHEGHDGWHAAGGPNGKNLLPNVYNWLTANPADIVLLHIGTNDISAGGQDANEVNDILDEIDEFSTDIKVILALIIDRKPSSPATIQFNIDVNNMAQSRIAAGDDIIVVDMESALNYVNDMFDSVHPNDVGYAKMANVWYNALDDCLVVKRTLTCSSTAGGSVLEPGEGSFEYAHGTDVNLIASVDPNYYFVEWTGTAVDAGKVAEPNSTTTMVTMDANYTVVANFAADRTWDDDGDPNELWSLGLNWSDNTVPTVADTATINMNNVNCLIDSSVGADCSTLTVGLNGPTKACSLTMTGGFLTSAGNISIGEDSDANGTFTMSGGTVNTGASARVWIGYGENEANFAYGTLIMSGGQFNVGGDKLELGKNAQGIGKIFMDGGTLNLSGASCDFEFGTYGNATLVMTEGDVNIDDKLRLAENGGTATIDMYGGNIYCSDLVMNNGTPTIYLDGGVILCNEIEMLGDNAKIDITEGELIVETDAELADIQSYISAGKIVGYNDVGIVDVDTSGGVITVTARIGDPNLAWKPNPKDYAKVGWTPAGPTLSWKLGRYTQDVNGHNVYFGTNENDVNAATDPNTLPGRGNQDPCTFAFPSSAPVLGETYYWRIDEVNDTCSPYLWKGNVWELTMDDYEVVEDFDSYADETALETVWSLAGSTDITIEETIVQSGKSMKYEYDISSSPYYSEASANTSGANKLPVDTQGWTSAGIEALTLYFSGNGTNAVEPMYVVLEDISNKSATVYYGDGEGEDPNDIKDPDWHEWNIELSDFSDLNDVNLESISTVYIGFGDEASPGGSGTVYFDDIRLYPTRCVASYAPAGDVDGDCIVNLVDVNMMGDDWLEMDYTGVGYDGVLTNFISPGCWVAGKYNSGLQFDGTDDWVDIDDSDFSNFHNKTIAFWVKILEYPSVYRYMFYFSDDAPENPYRIYFMTRTPGNVRVHFLEDYTENFATGTGIWRHLAFVLEDTADGRCTGKFYGDGSLVGTAMPGRPRHSGGAVGVNIGSFFNGVAAFMKAVIDDFRVYDRSLSTAEVQTLYAGGEPDANMLLHYKFDEESGETAVNSSTYVFNHPLLSDAELYEGEAVGSRVVNFMDYVILADSWLKEQLWP